MAEINYRLLLKIIVLLLFVEAFFMLIPLVTSLLYGGSDFMPFLYTLLITSGCAGIMVLCGKNASNHVGKREGFLLVSVTWLFFSFFGMLPFIFSGYAPRIVDAFFETMSGFTTTGATVLENINILPHGINIWRCLIQWLGGMGIILFTLAVLPMLNSGGGIQLFNAEVTGVTHDKLSPRISQTAKKLWVVYCTITAVLVILLFMGPMNLFEAVCHAMSTMGTGGFSTRQESIIYWNSSYTEYVIAIFMIIAGINFSLVYRAVKGDYSKLIHSEELRWFLIMVIGAIIIIMTGLYITGQWEGFEKTFRMTFFQVSSIISTTGFSTADYTVWGPFFCVIILILMFFGACAGSTSGGAKIDRMVILIKNIKNEFYRAIHPNAVVPIRVNSKLISHELVTKTMAFLIVYMFVIVASTVSLTALGLSMDESFGAALSCISNVGPGLEASGPAGDYSHIPESGKWILSFVMFIGRLELFTVLILFTKYFWKK